MLKRYFDFLQLMLTSITFLNMNASILLNTVILVLYMVSNDTINELTYLAEKIIRREVQLLDILLINTIVLIIIITQLYRNFNKNVKIFEGTFSEFLFGKNQTTIAVN